MLIQANEKTPFCLYFFDCSYFYKKNCSQPQPPGLTAGLGGYPHHNSGCGYDLHWPRDKRNWMKDEIQVLISLPKV